MKKRSLFFVFGIILSCFMLAIAVGKPKSAKNNAQAYFKQAFIDWDSERKLIFAYQNSIIIEGEGEGTTIYLDAPAGWSWGETLSSGNGELGEEDLSLAEIYELNTASYDEEAPADGADLSEWSIVFGAENPFVSIESKVKMSVVMNGGKLKTIYAGHASYQAESCAYLNGQVVCVVNGGEIGTLYTDSGYVEKGDIGKAEGSKNIKFYLNGGKINKLIRSDIMKLTYASVVYVKGNVKIYNIDYKTFRLGEPITLDGNLANDAVLSFDLENNFERSDVIISSIDEDYIESLNLSVITLLNPPANSNDWEIYKNSKFVRYGYNQKITSIEIQGSAKVGETLTLKVTPEKATVSTISWYRKDEFLNVISWISYGESYTIKNEDGGKLIYAVAIDKNDIAKRYSYEISEPVERAYKPSVVVEDGKTTIYANGNDLIISKSGNGTTIYLDKGTIGALDLSDVSIKDAGIENAPENGSDLSNVCVSAGSNLEMGIGELSVTMLSGTVGEINTISANDKKIDGDVLLNLKGGTVKIVNAGKKYCDDDALVYLSGDINAKIYGMQHENAPTSIRIKNALTCQNGGIVVVVNDDFSEEGIFVIADNEGHLDASKFTIQKNNGTVVNCFALSKSEYTLKISPVKILSAQIVGKNKVGKVLLVEFNPTNAFFHNVQWFRSTTNSFENAERIENANGITYTLTSEDYGKYIFVVVDGDLETEQILMTNGIIKKGLPAWAVALIVVASVLAVLIAAIIIWYVLWKKQKIGAGFMKTIFEKFNSQTSNK